MTVILVTFLVVLLLGAPVVFAFAFASLAYILFVSKLPFDLFAPVLYSALDSFPLMAIPLFLFAGEIMSKGGISRRIIAFAEALVGRVKGYLGLITIIASAFFSAVSGSGIATVAAVGSMMIPEMKKANYPAGYAATLTASAAYLGIIIPPSIPMVMYGFISNTSIGDLFIGGVIPGIILMFCFIGINAYYANKIDIGIATDPKSVIKEISNVPLQKAEKWRKVFVTAKGAFWALLMPVIILAGIYSGLFTPTESAVIAVVYALLIASVVYRELKFSSFLHVTKTSALNTSMLLITLVFATIFSRLLTIEQIPQKLAEVLVGLTDQRWLIILILIAFLLFIGMLVDAITGVILVTPILYPIMTAIEMDPVHAGVLIVVALAVGLITPPMAVNLFLASKIAEASMRSIFVYLPIFIIVSVIVVILIAFIPDIVLFLPNLVRS